VCIPAVENLPAALVAFESRNGYTVGKVKYGKAWKENAENIGFDFRGNEAGF